MANAPEMYNLSWTYTPREFLTMGQLLGQPPRRGSWPIALQKPQILNDRVFFAGILYPAFLTPAILVKGTHGDAFEVLLGTYEDLPPPEILAVIVNDRLKITKGLGRCGSATLPRLFPDPTGKIKVKSVTPDEHGIIRTASQFKGIIDRRFYDRCVRGAYSNLFAVQIDASCLARAGQPDPSLDEREALDNAIDDALRRLNGPELGGEQLGGRPDGVGTHCFTMNGNSVDLRTADKSRPVRAYHPLFVYHSLEHASFGHISDLHVNSRQQFLRRSAARVVDFGDEDGKAGDASPVLGFLVNDTTANVASIMEELGKDKRVDVLLVGGDDVDHIRNVFPPQNDRALLTPTVKPLPPALVWDLVDLDDDGRYKRNYQAFVDHLTFYTLVHYFYEKHKKPVFGVTGNHDAYYEPYGISPRWVFKGIRANAGIPADHNLTFYEAILVFGKSYRKLRGPLTRSSFDPRWFEWFHTVLTPLSDFAVSFNKQRLVGLAWGEEEDMIDVPKTAHGYTHLPRSDTAASDDQLALALDGHSSTEKTVLLTHFTFVSYGEKLSNDPEPRAGSIRFKAYTEQDFGTFETNRRALYEAVANSKNTQFVVTGHSHRKGVYFLGSETADGFPTEMYSLAGNRFRQALAKGDRTPIVVSDCAGPLPRLNARDELREWGSDRPSGTLIEVSPGGAVAKIEPVYATTAAKPRLAVALEYLHVDKEMIFDGIETRRFRSEERLTVEHAIVLHFHQEFPPDVSLAGVTVYGRPSQDERWTAVELGISQDAQSPRTFIAAAPTGKPSQDLYKWLSTRGPGRFLSLRFTAVGDVDRRYDTTDGWNFEIDTVLREEQEREVYERRAVMVPTGRVYYTIKPLCEEPSFAWRTKFDKYKKQC